MTTLQTVFAVFADGWFVEVPNESQANTIKNLLKAEGIEAHVRESLPAAFALIVEFTPKYAGRRNHNPAVRRHKWAYGDWKKGPPKGFNGLTGEMPDYFAVKRTYAGKGATVWYKSESQLTPEEQVKFLNAGAVPSNPPIKRHVNAATGKETVFADAAFWQ